MAEVTAPAHLTARGEKSPRVARGRTARRGPKGSRVPRGDHTAPRKSTPSPAEAPARTRRLSLDLAAAGLDPATGYLSLWSGGGGSEPLGAYLERGPRPPLARSIY
jgi:hypothetical protein